MAITTADLKRMQRDIEKLKKQVARLERGGNGKRRATRKPRPAVPRARKRRASENERVEEILRRAGMLAELAPEEKAMAAEWRALPEEEKQRAQETLWNLSLKEPLSQIIIENR